jgi:RHS repeat-associated protein
MQFYSRFLRSTLALFLTFTISIALSSQAAAESLSKGSSKAYQIAISEIGTYNVSMNVTSGDCDLYGKFGSTPTTDSYDNKSDRTGSSDESFSFTPNASGYYKILVYAYSACAFNTPTSNFTPQLASPGSFSNVYPANGASLTSNPSYIDWNSSSNATNYELYLNGNRVYSGSSSRWTLNQTLNVGTHSWYVKASNSSGTRTGGTWTFSRASNTATPPIFSSGNASVTGASVNFTSSWSDSDDPYVVNARARYHKTGSSGWTEASMSHVSGFNFSTTRTISSPGTYEYQFQASAAKTASSSGVASNWSSASTFTIDESDISPSLSVTIQGNGRVHSLPSGIDCGSDCTRTYAENQAIQLYATADSGWKFSEWQGQSGCSTLTTCAFNVNNDTTISAVFVEMPEPEIGMRLTNFYPKSIPQGEVTQVTLEGIDLPLSLVANIQGTSGYCVVTTHSTNKIVMNCKPGASGSKHFYVQDKLGTAGGIRIAGSENWYMAVTLPANTAPSIWVDQAYKKYSYVNSSYSITAKSWDAEKNLKSIQVDWQANDQWGLLVTVSNPQGQEVPFSYIPDTTGVLNVRFRAVDENGAFGISETYRIQIQPQPQPETEVVEPSTGTQAAEKVAQTIATECEGNPITPANGAKVEARSLLSVNGLVPINFDLQYHSLIRGKSNVGIGWDFANAYAAKVVEDTDGKVTVHWSENKAHVFNPNGDGSYTPESHACRLDTLQKLSTGQFKLERSGRDVYFFDEFNFLKRIENEKGQGLDFDYNTESQLAKVIESVSGKYIEYSYNEDGYLVQATTNGDHTVYLEYLEGRLSKITHADSTVEEFTYTELDQIHTRSLGGVVLSTTTYDEFGRAINQDDAKSDNQKLSFNYTETTDRITTKVTDRNGNQKAMVFDKNYKLLQETDPIGLSKTYQYTDGGQPTSITDGNGNTTSITYNQYGDITSITTADGSTETRTYDSRRNLLKVTNAYGKEKAFTYDVSNNLITSIDELGNTTNYSYDSNHQLISETTPEGRVIQFAYTAGLLTSITNPKGNTRYLEYDQDGRLIAESDYQNNYTRYELDALGRKLSETDPLSNRQTWAYDARGNVLTYTDAKGNQTSHEYNDQGERVKTTQSNNGTDSVWQFKYDGEGRLIESIDPNGNSTRYERDPLGRITKMVDALGNITEHQYDANDNVIKAIDPLSQASASSFDTMNRVTQASDSLGNTTSLNYDALGRIHSVTDATSRFVQNSYDALSRLTNVLHPGSLTAKQGFDNDSQLTSVTTPSDDTRSLVLDNNTNVSNETTADSVLLQYQYNSNDLLTGFINGRNQSVSYNYDVASRLIQKNDAVSTIDYGYDENHNLKQVTENGVRIEREYDGFDRVTQYKEDANEQRRILYEFDKSGNLTSLVYPHTTDSPSGFPINYVYDVLNRVTTVSGFKADVVAASYQYDSKGRIATLTRGNGSVLTLSYDAADRLTSSIDKDASSNIIVEQSYRYDAIGRLTQETITPESSPPSELIQQVPMTFGADNRLLSKDGKTFDYDDDGNILEAEGQTLQFNARNQLVKAGDYTYQYNAEGHRVARSSTIDGSLKQTTYVVSPHHLGLAQTLRETKEDGIDSDFIYGVQGLLAQFNRHENKHFYFHYDYRGSVIAITDDQGQVVARYGYLPFGKQYSVSGSFDTPFGYNGRDGVVTDPNGLIYMRARYYSPDQHRFVSKDPLRGGITDLASLNRYAYVGGDPVNSVDPSGEIIWFIPWAAYAVVSAAWTAYDVYNTVYDNCLTAYEKATSLGIDVAIGVSSGAAGKFAYKLFKKAQQVKDVTKSAPKYVRNKYKSVSQSEKTLVKKDNPICVYCEKKPSATVDHIRSQKQDWKEGGFKDSRNVRSARVNDPSNLTGACSSCNPSKGSKPLGTGVGQWTPPKDR